MSNDPVNKPSHYTDGKIEVIDFIEDKNLGFHLGNSVKYIARAGKKDPSKTIEDLQKAAWYLNREIERLQPDEVIQHLSNGTKVKVSPSTASESPEEFPLELKVLGILLKSNNPKSCGKIVETLLKQGETISADTLKSRVDIILEELHDRGVIRVTNAGVPWLYYL